MVRFFDSSTDLIVVNIADSRDTVIMVSKIHPRKHLLKRAAVDSAFGADFRTNKIFITIGHNIGTGFKL